MDELDAYQLVFRLLAGINFLVSLAHLLRLRYKGAELRTRLQRWVFLAAVGIAVRGIYPPYPLRGGEAYGLPCVFFFAADTWSSACLYTVALVFLRFLLTAYRLPGEEDEERVGGAVCFTTGHYLMMAAVWASCGAVVYPIIYGPEEETKYWIAGLTFVLAAVSFTVAVQTHRQRTVIEAALSQCTAAVAPSSSSIDPSDTGLPCRLTTIYSRFRSLCVYMFAVTAAIGTAELAAGITELVLPASFPIARPFSEPQAGLDLWLYQSYPSCAQQVIVLTWNAVTWTWTPEKILAGSAVFTSPLLSAAASPSKAGAVEAEDEEGGDHYYHHRHHLQYAGSGSKKQQRRKSRNGRGSGGSPRVLSHVTALDYDGGDADEEAGEAEAHAVPEDHPYYIHAAVYPSIAAAASAAPALPVEESPMLAGWAGVVPSDHLEAELLRRSQHQPSLRVDRNPSMAIPVDRSGGRVGPPPLALPPSSSWLPDTSATAGLYPSTDRGLGKNGNVPQSHSLAVPNAGRARLSSDASSLSLASSTGGESPAGSLQQAALLSANGSMVSTGSLTMTHSLPPRDRTSSNPLGFWDRTAEL